jgi:hypothetical protein
MCFSWVSIYKYPLFEYVLYETILASKIVDIVKQHKLQICMLTMPFRMQCCFNGEKYFSRTGINIVTTLHGTDITLVERSNIRTCGVLFNQSLGCCHGGFRSLKQDTHHYSNSLSEKGAFQDGHSS